MIRQAFRFGTRWGPWEARFYEENFWESDLTENFTIDVSRAL
jgi:hypothetical protein